MKKYTLGFIFDTSLQHVLLIHKLAPDWQRGYLNGIGGKLEEGETSIDCIVREVQEESALHIPAADWTYLGNMHADQWVVDMYTAIYRGNLIDARKNDKEEVEWVETNKLPVNSISNLSWLIPFARYKLQNPHIKEALIRYA